MPGVSPAGDYQVWVHGFTVLGTDSKFDLSIEVITGDDLNISDVPSEVKAGEETRFQVCAEVAALDPTTEGPLRGLVQAGPGGAPTLFTIPVSWVRSGPTIHLPAVLRDAELGTAATP